MQIKFKIFAFTAFEDISEYIMKQCDIAILDIDFSKRQYCGIDIAKKLREIKKGRCNYFRYKLYRIRTGGL